MAGLERKHIRIQWVVLIVSVVLMAAKFLAWQITGSNMILTDAMESIVNVVAGAFGLYSLVLASKPRDTDHPYGHGKIEYISASVEGFMILAAGVFIIGKSIYSFWHPPAISELPLGIALSAATGVVNLMVGYWVLRNGKKAGSHTLMAAGKHLLSDSYSTGRLLVGLALVFFTSVEWIDYAVAVLFGGLIVYSGYRILRSSVGGIMDEADYSILKKVIDVLSANRKKTWIDIHNMRVIKYGTAFHIDCHITVPYYFTVQEAHNEVDEIEQLVKSHFENTVELFIHVDPCIPASCPLCQITDCPVRKFPMEGKVEWNLENVMRNRKHQL